MTKTLLLLAALAVSGSSAGTQPRAQAATNGSPRRCPVAPVILDGFRLPYDTEALSDLNPNDIEKIDVLKGPSAAALYGPSAAGGVLVMTSRLPLLVRGQVLRPTAEKAAAAQNSSSRQVSHIRALTAEETARYGLAPGTRALALTLEGKARVSPQRLQALPFGY